MDISNAEKLVQLVRNELGENSPIQHISVFLAVARAEARAEDVEVLDIGARCSLSSSSTSRNLSALGDWSWRQKAGLGLVKLVPMMADRRRKLVRLTTEGKKLVKRINAL